jgi:hypothetical protein
MAWLNTGMRRQDIVSGIRKNQWVITQPSGARFSNDHGDNQVYLNGVVVDPLLAVYFDIPNDLAVANPPINGRLGVYISIATATAAPTAGVGTIDTITTVARGRKHVVADTTGKVVAEWDARTEKTTALGEDLGKHDNLAEAIEAITLALQTGTPTESDDLTRVPADAAHIYDADLNKWHINADPALGFVGALFLNSTNTGGVADQLLYFTSIVYHHNPQTGHWYHRVGTEFIDDGYVDPTLPDPSADWFTVPDDGAFLIDDEGVRIELGPAAGSGFNILRGGAVWTTPNGGGAWGDKIKIGTGAPPRLVDHRNPLGLGWIHASGNTWTQPHADHEGGDPEPVSGTTTGTISSGSLNVVTVADTTGFAVGDDVYIEPLTREGVGPGGAWPFTRYANASQRNAALGSHSEGAHVGQTDDGFAYIKVQGSWERADGFAGGRFYQSRIRSIGHWGRITNISGNALTLNRTAQQAVTDAIVHWDGAPQLYNWIQNAANGASTASRTVLNANTFFPGRTSVCLAGHIVPQNKHNIRVTCDARDSILFYSPPGAPCAAFQWVSCTGCIYELAEIRGNFTPADYGMGWQSSTVARTSGYLGDTSVGIGQIAPSGMEFYSSDNCEARDYTITNSPIRAGGAQFSSNIWIRRAKNVMTAPLKEYVQWQFQFDLCNGGGFEDCEIDSVAIIAGFEIFKCTNSVIFRPKGRNATIAVNNSGGWVLFRDPNNPNAGTGELRFDPDCYVGVEDTPYFFQYANGTRAINVNRNVGTEYTGPGGLLNGPVVIQPGYLTSDDKNIAAVQIHTLLPNIVVRGLRASFPAVRVNGPGATGIIGEGPGARYSDCIVTGEAWNSGTDWGFYILNGFDDGGLICNPGSKNVNGVIT